MEYIITAVFSNVVDQLIEQETYSTRVDHPNTPPVRDTQNCKSDY